MSVSLISHPVTPSVQSARTIAEPSCEVAFQRATAEMDRFLKLLESLAPDDWNQPTMCTGWAVRDIVAHQAGAYSGWATFGEFRRQLMTPTAKGQDKIDAINAQQVQKRAERTPAELIAELRDLAPKAVLNRKNLPALIRWMPVPPTADYPKMTMGELADFIYARDTWMHRIDVCISVGIEPSLTSDHDRAVAELIMRDLDKYLTSRLKGATVDYSLTGPLAGVYRYGAGQTADAQLTVDGLTFHLLASGRLSPQAAQSKIHIEGNREVAARAIAHTKVMY
jgi:uncharacterized protein (TIGR03083 family)